MKQKIVSLITLLSLASFSISSSEELHFELSPPESEEKAITVNFQDVSMLEFLRFVSQIAEVNFIYDEKVLDFNISLVTGKATNPGKILEIMVELLNQQGIKAEQKCEYFLVEKMEEWELEEKRLLSLAKYRGQAERKVEVRTVSDQKDSQLLSFHEFQKKGDFHVYKLQYHVGAEILSAIKNVGETIKHNTNASKDLAQAIDSMQWVQSTNSILYSGSENGIDELTDLIQSLDIPKKQVFIEVLVIETNVKKGLEFGLEWGSGGKYKNQFGYGLGNFSGDSEPSSFSKTLRGINSTATPTGAEQFPLGKGFDLGVIGDIILHKGATYLSLGSLVSALQSDGDSTIILNQKIITQDNKLSRIFVGDNIAFTGSTVETVGASQQTSANIEYRDVGVKLNITPLLGDGDMITLEISEEITDIIPDFNSTTNYSSSGINTTKTDMATQVHVPDQSFLVLSGMIRNTKRHNKRAIPCLGGLPLIGAAFSNTNDLEEKRNIIVFVRPQIIHTSQEYQNITAFQESQYKKEAMYPSDFQKGISMLQRERTIYENKRTPEQASLTAITDNKSS